MNNLEQKLLSILDFTDVFGGLVQFMYCVQYCCKYVNNVSFWRVGCGVR